MISRTVIVFMLAFACVHGDRPSCNNTIYDSKLAPWGKAVLDGIGICNIHPRYGSARCNKHTGLTAMSSPPNPVMRYYWPAFDHAPVLDCRDGVATPAPQPIKKELLRASPRAFGPRVTDCNPCFQLFPRIRHSCNAYDGWEKVRSCVLTKTLSVSDVVGTLYQAEKPADRKFICDEIEISTVAGACILRNVASKRGQKHCMKEEDCTKFLSTTNRTSETKPSFDGVTNDFPVCEGVSNWFTNPPACSDGVALNKVKKCLLEGDQSKWNVVAKGYVRAWFEEYYYRVCHGENHHSKMAGANAVKTMYYDDIWSYNAEQREKITVKGLNWNR